MAVKGVTEPRIFTPPLRELTSATTYGFAAIEFAEDVCGVTLYPWQKWLLIHALELDPKFVVGKPGAAFRYRTVVVLVARQQGKSMLSVVLSLFFMYVLGTDMVLGTAQDLDVAEEIWQEAADLIDDVPELLELRKPLVKAAGKKAIVLKTGPRYKVKAANRRAGRGLSGDLILLDELREHQSWDSWGAITHTTMARPNAQIWALSNAGDATSVVLRHLRKMAHKAIGDPDGLLAGEDPNSLLEEVPDDVDDVRSDDSLGLFEWSSPPGADIHDISALSQANPSLGFGLVTERSLLSAAATDPEWVFRTECMCQWTDGTLEGPFPPGTWEAGVDSESLIPENVKVYAGVDVSVDRAWSHIAFAALNGDGLPHVEVVARRAGTDWVIPWLQDRAEIICEVTGQTNGAPVSSLMVEIAAETSIPVSAQAGPDLGRSCGMFYDLVREGKLRHLPQPTLDVAAATVVTRPAGDAWIWDRKRSPTDIAPLIAATAATWLLERPKEDATSVYETRGALVLNL